MKRSAFLLGLINIAVADELSFDIKLDHNFTSTSFQSSIVDEFLKQDVKKSKPKEKSKEEKPKAKVKDTKLAFKADGTPLIILEQIKDFSKYGYSDKDITPLYSLDEYQKVKGEENKKIQQEKKHRYQEQNKTYEDQIDAFFN